MSIRRYNPSDFQKIIDIITAVNDIAFWQSIHVGGWDEKKIRFETLVDRYANPLFFVAESEQETVGFAVGHEFTPFVDQEIPHLKGKIGEKQRVFYQRHVLVHPQYQREGIAKQLCDTLERQVREEGYLQLITRTHKDNNAGKTLFSRLGFDSQFTDYSSNKTYFQKFLS